YVAASSVLHVFDGWSYLGRAIECALRGDIDASRHLAYYAELRAAMSVLGSEGVGIFSSHHVAIDSLGVVHRINRKTRKDWQRLATHQFVWPCLEYWSSLSRASELLGQVIRPRGIEFSEWLDALGVG